MLALLPLAELRPTALILHLSPQERDVRIPIPVETGTNDAAVFTVRRSFTYCCMQQILRDIVFCERREVRLCLSFVYVVSL